MRSYKSTRVWQSTSAIREARGSVELTRTPTAYCVSTSPKEPTSVDIPNANSTRSQTHSTPDRAKPLSGRPPPKHLKSYYPKLKYQVLQRLLEPKLRATIRMMHRTWTWLATEPCHC